METPYQRLLKKNKDLEKENAKLSEQVERLLFEIKKSEPTDKLLIHMHDYGLTKMEATVFDAMFSHPGTIVMRETIYSIMTVKGRLLPNDENWDHNVSACIRRIRRKVEHEWKISCTRNVGYSMVSHTPAKNPREKAET